MNIIVPATRRDTVAGRALHCEGVPHTVVVLEDDTAYARLLGDAWRTGTGFILVEDDIAPWPGALRRLWECDMPWCGFDYSIGFGRFGLGTLGCVKFSAGLVTEHPDLWRRWEGVHWHALDASVTGAVKSAVGATGFHEHWPPVAHCQHLR